MPKEFSAGELEEYSAEHHGQYIVQLRMLADGWRSFRLDEAERRRFEIIENNASYDGEFNVFRAVAARMTGVPELGVEAVGLQGHVLTIVPVCEK